MHPPDLVRTKRKNEKTWQAEFMKKTGFNQIEDMYIGMTNNTKQFNTNDFISANAKHYL